MQNIYTSAGKFSFNEIKEGQFNVVDSYLNDTLHFCKDWLSGVPHFTFTTSGSTGSPKAITADRAHMLMSANGTIKAVQLTENEHVYLCISSKMIGGAMMLVRAMELGCDITIVSPTSNPIESLDENHPYTFVSFVPMQVFEVQTDESIQQKLNRFKHILLGGAPANENTLQALSKLTCEVWQTYGMTETLSHIALRRIGKDKYYKVLDGVHIKTDERKCLCISSPITDDQWLLTNDVVNLIDDTHFELVGRIDDVINSGGIKIFSYDVEHEIIEKMNDLEIPPKPMFVCRKPDDKFGETVVVVMMGEKLSDEVIEQLVEHCKQTLGKYAAPKQFFFVNEFEKLESGKLDKKSTLQKVINKA